MLTILQATNIREILVCATLSERPIKVEFKSQPDASLQKLLQLVQMIQTGCKIEVNPRGLTYIPGIITNGKFDFECGLERSIGYYLEALMLLSIFGKQELNIQLSGLTNDSLDQSIDSIINALVPLYKQYLPDWQMSLKVMRRGYRPCPSGKVHFQSQPVKYISSKDILERGPIKRIRGVCSGAKVAPNILNRVVSSCRGVFNDYIPDVWIHTDFQKSGKGSELANGYAVSLVGESEKGAFICVDCEYEQKSDEADGVGEKAALRLLDEIKHSGCVDTSNQQYALLLMALSEKKLSQLRIGRISVHTIETLRVIRDLLGVTFHIAQPEENQEEIQQEENKIQPTMIFSCFGCGLTNMSRQTY